MGQAVRASKQVRVSKNPLHEALRGQPGMTGRNPGGLEAARTLQMRDLLIRLGSPGVGVGGGVDRASLMVLLALLVHRASSKGVWLFITTHALDFAQVFALTSAQSSPVRSILSAERT